MEDTGSGIDNLSRLPDDILSRILSLLYTEDAVRTSVLSTRWRYLYTSISNLDLKFNSRIYENTDEQDCMNFVDRFLFYRKKCAIGKFKLEWDMSQAVDPLRLENWIKAVLGHGIRELDLCIYDFDPKDLLLPSSLFTCKSLEVLKLDIWKSDDSETDSESGDYGLKIPANVCLPSLKSIELNNVSFWGENSWSRLFSNCPVLEEFFYCITRGGDCYLHVSSPTLKRLTITREYGFIVVFVDAPSLVYLRSCTDEAQYLKFVNAPSLVEADIEFRSEVGRTPSLNRVYSELMRGISSTQTLRMCTATLEVLEHNRVPIPVLHNMTHLTLYDCYHSLAALPNLLEKCESLETLVLEDFCEWDPDIWNGVEEYRISCMTSVVKTIEVGAFSGDEDELEMVKYFLKTARVLELIKIHLEFDCENPMIANELQMLPKNSNAFVDVRF